MAKKKAAGKLKQQKRPQPKYLGLKVSDGQTVPSGSVLVKQRGTKLRAGQNVGVGRDHTLFATSEGTVKFTQKHGNKYLSIVTK